MSLTKLPLGRNNSVMASLFPPRESLVVTSRLGTGNSRTFFYGVYTSGQGYKDILIPHLASVLLKELKPVVEHVHRICMDDIQHCFICRPSDSTVSETGQLRLRHWLHVRRSNHSARSHPRINSKYDRFVCGKIVRPMMTFSAKKIKYVQYMKISYSFK